MHICVCMCVHIYACICIYNVCITNEEINAAEISEEFMFTFDRFKGLRFCQHHRGRYNYYCPVASEPANYIC